MVSISYGQTPILTAIVDGDCAGGTPKLLEIFAKGTVDFSLFSLENQTNANTDWGSTTDLSSFGIVTDGFVYVTTSTSDVAFESEFPSALSSPVLISGVMNLNGDDRIRIIETTTSMVIDQYGIDGVDGTASLWEYKDSYARRINGTLPDGTFTMSNWMIPSVSTLNELGVCQGGSETFETIMGGIGNYDIVLSNETFQASEIRIYPNPARDIVIVETGFENLVDITIYDLLGKQVMSEVLTGNRLDVSSLNSGIYLLKVSQNNASVVKRLIIK